MAPVIVLLIFSFVAGSQLIDSKPRLESSEFNPVDGLSHSAPNAARGMWKACKPIEYNVYESKDRTGISCKPSIK